MRKSKFSESQMGAILKEADSYLTREEARSDIFNYIEMFYNSKRRHGHANGVSPVQFDQQYFNRLNCV